jgi:hypothetical protein
LPPLSAISGGSLLRNNENVGVFQNQCPKYAEFGNLGDYAEFGIFLVRTSRERWLTFSRYPVFPLT